MSHLAEPTGRSRLQLASAGLSLLNALVMLLAVVGLAVSLLAEIGSWAFDYGFPFLWVAGVCAVTLFVTVKAGEAAEAATKSRHARAACATRAADRRIADNALTPDQMLVREHFPGAVFLTEEQKRDERRIAAALQAAPKPKQRRAAPPIRHWQDAEVSVANWMKDNGHQDVRKTPPGADGGVDVVSARAIAQVKHLDRPVGPEPVERLAGTAQRKKHTGAETLFFSTSGYSPEAQAAGKDLGMELYQLDKNNEWKRVV